MICDFEDVNRTGMIKTIYDGSMINIYEFVETEIVRFRRRVDIAYDKEAVAELLIKSAHICLESFDLQCINDSYADHVGTHAVACRCKRFMRQTVMTFWSNSQKPSNGFSRPNSGNGHNTSAR